jgi:hypothetical protein
MAIEKEQLRLLFLEYLMANGFDNQDVRNILEVGNSVENSVSIVLPTNRYDQLLLSTKVEPSMLERYKINGVKGYIFRGEMYHLINNHDFPREEDKITDGLNIKDFDTLLSMGFGNEHRHAMYSLKMIRKFIGQCVAYDNNRTKRYYDGLYQSECQYMDEECGEKHILVTDVDSTKNVDYYLIKKKSL